jgi:hypothetical protein
MLRKAGMVACFLSAFAFFNLCSSKELFIGPEDVPFVIGTDAEYTVNANMFTWTQFDSTATIWDLTVYPGEQTATVHLLDPSQGIPPAPDTFASAEVLELDTLGPGSITWTYMSKDDFYLYGQGIDFESGYRFIGNYQPNCQIYFTPMYLGNGWITAWTWTYLLEGWLPYSANEIHQKQIVSRGWVKTEVTAGQYWPCLVIRDNYTFTDNFGSNDQRWLYEWIVAGRFAGGNGLAAAQSTNGASKDFVIVNKMLRMKSLNIPGWDLTLPVFDSTTIWTDTTFGGPYPVSTIITDDDGIGADSLFYRVGSDTFIGLGHDSVVGDKYFFVIPEVASSCTISYYLWAEDSFSVVNGIDIWATDPEAAPENNLITFVVTLTGIAEGLHENGERASVSAFPNPFSSSVCIRQEGISGAGDAVLTIYDQSGRRVRGIGLSKGSGGSVYWDGTDEVGRPLASGTYFAVIEGRSLARPIHTIKLTKVE